MWKFPTKKKNIVSFRGCFSYERGMGLIWEKVMTIHWTWGVAHWWIQMVSKDLMADWGEERLIIRRPAGFFLKCGKFQFFLRSRNKWLCLTGDYPEKACVFFLGAGNWWFTCRKQQTHRLNHDSSTSRKALDCGMATLSTVDPDGWEKGKTIKDLQVSQQKTRQPTQ